MIQEVPGDDARAAKVAGTPKKSSPGRKPRAPLGEVPELDGERMDRSDTRAAGPAEDILRTYLEGSLQQPLMKKREEVAAAQVMDAARVAYAAEIFKLRIGVQYAKEQIRAVIRGDTQPHEVLRRREGEFSSEDLKIARSVSLAIAKWEKLGPGVPPPLALTTRIAAIPWKVTLLEVWRDAIGVQVGEVRELLATRDPAHVDALCGPRFGTDTLGVVRAHQCIESSREGFTTARNVLIEANLRWAVHQARSQIGKGLEFIDLIQEANTGLIRAANGYDHTTGFKFTTYATWWIRQSMQRGIADTSRLIRIPVYRLTELGAVRKAEAEFTSDTLREPTLAELAAITGVTEKDLRQLKSVSVVGSLEQDRIPGQDSAMKDFVVDKKTVEASAGIQIESCRERMETVFRYLDSRSERVLKLRFGWDGEPLTLEEVGRVLKVTRERVRQIEAKALRKLKGYMAREGLSMDDLVG